MKGWHSGVAAGLVRRRTSAVEKAPIISWRNTLTRPVIGLAMFAANISTVHLVISRKQLISSTAFGNVNAGWSFTLILLSLFFAPLYLRSRLLRYLIFLELRLQSRLPTLSIISLFRQSRHPHTGVALIAAAQGALRGILGLAPDATIFGVNALILFIATAGRLDWHVITVFGGCWLVVCDRKCSNHFATRFVPS